MTKGKLVLQKDMEDLSLIVVSFRIVQDLIQVDANQKNEIAIWNWR